MKKLFAIYFLFIASQLLASALDLYVLTDHPALFPTYSDISTIVFLLWGAAWTIWFFRTDARLHGARFSYSMAFGLVLIPPVTSFIYFFTTRSGMAGFLHALGFWAGIVAAFLIGEAIYEQAV